MTLMINQLISGLETYNKQKYHLRYRDKSVILSYLCILSTIRFKVPTAGGQKIKTTLKRNSIKTQKGKNA
jgi:hypothetical protein